MIAADLHTSPNAQAFRRASETPDYFTWLDHVSSAAGCSLPIRLAGRIATIDTATGATIATASTEAMPDGVIYKNCGNRRASVCPSCSTTYRRDAYQLIRAGLAGGKGVPTTVAGHPTVFATFTAPGFGPVHTQRTNKTGRPIPCRPRRDVDLCPHGVDLRCDHVHGDGDRALGLPLCLDCYDHAHQIVWNHFAGELWRRTRTAVDRALRQIAANFGIDPDLVRLSYSKVAEMQRRGVVHFHAIIRLDGVDPDNREAVVSPPPDIKLIDLISSIQHAVRRTSFVSPPHHFQPFGWRIAWSDQLDVRSIRTTGDITDEKVAGYVANASKSTEATGHLSRRLTRESIDLYADPQGSHVERLIHACLFLGGYVEDVSISVEVEWRSPT